MLQALPLISWELKRNYAMNTKKDLAKEKNSDKPVPDADSVSDSLSQKDQSIEATSPKEIGGPKGPNPTRYGDWERKGRCVDF